MDPRMPQFLLKSCVRCGGDLTLDEGDWLCLQCGRYYYARPTAGAIPLGTVLSRWREQLRRPLPGDGPPPPRQATSSLAGPGESGLAPGYPWCAATLTSSLHSLLRQE